ncbi:esterase B1-like [Episyrphus balteatus]|uniref:esterase B1-like n=1 Tax=Episyrphus balteatus TaxID=286459 RepID=UPI002486ABD4|nr:esterase B1-like [Episyrphus balteatus]
MDAKVSFGNKLIFRYRNQEHKLNQYLNNTGETVVAETEYGKIKGAKRKSLYDKLYYSFEKIPYAEPPLGSLRFKAPQPPKAWNDVLDCTQMNPKPVQRHLILDFIDGTEDCLYLNVYTNDLEPAKPRPVMVWIYGGAFILGEANRDWYGPDLLMNKDIVLVTLNYRVNALGFLSLKDPQLNVPGNAGLKDQVLALKWIKNNCARFGGDPDNITVFGESAGGASTHYMCITDQTKGLFHRAVMMSGAAIAPWGSVKQSNYPYRLAKHCGYTGEENEKDVLEFLQKIEPGNLVVEDKQLLTPQEERDGIFFCFGPTVEPYNCEDCVVPKEPLEMMKTAWSNSIPIITGFVSSEGLLFHPALSKQPQALAALETCAYLVPSELVEDRESKECLEMGRKLKEAHVCKDSPLDSLLEILGFRHFVHPMAQFIQSRAKEATAPTYLYRFDFESHNLYLPFNFIHEKNLNGVGHGSELCYLFNSITGRKMDVNSKEYKTIERMTGLFSQFAIASDPNCEATKSVKWEPLKKDDDVLKCLNISDELAIIDLPEMDKIKVWDSLYSK